MQGGPGRSPKSMLQEFLARGSPGLEIQYLDSMLSPLESPTWVSDVRLVSAADGSVRLVATGQGSKKSSAQGAAAAALMALPTFEEALHQQQQSKPAVAALLQQQPIAAGMPLSPGAAVSPASAVAAAAAAAAAASTPVAPVTPAQQPGKRSAEEAGAMVTPPVAHTAATHAGLLAGRENAPAAAVGRLQLSGFPADPPASASSQQGVSTHRPAVRRGLFQPQAPGTPAPVPPSSILQSPSPSTAPVMGDAGPSVLWPGGSADSSADALPVVDPLTNYKGQLQECLQRWYAPAVQPAPVYSCTAQGQPHARTFTATVTALMPASLDDTAAAAPTAAAAAAIGIPPAAPQQTTLTVTGAPQSSRKKAEQAAAAAALSTPAVKPLLAALTRPQQQQQHHTQQLVQLLQSPPAMGLQAGSAHGVGSHLPLQLPASGLVSTPVQLLHDLVKQTAWALEPIAPVQVGGSSHRPLFEASVVINGHLLAVGQGNSKPAASHAAAARALECLRPPADTEAAGGLSGAAADAARMGPPGAAAAAGGSSSGNVSSTGMCALSATDIQDASLCLFRQLAQQASIRAPVISPARVTATALCTFLLQHGSSKPQVVALGTGTSFFAGPLQELADPAQEGRILLDCHAEVVARRSLLRWLYAQAEVLLAAHTQLQQQVDPTAAAALRQALDALPLEVVSGTGAGSCGSGSGSGSGSGPSHSGFKLRLKPGVKLHMYISKPPCGDASLFSRPANIGPAAGSAAPALHFASAKPRQCLPAAAAAGSSAGLLLPSQAALEAHWPQGSALLDPERVAANSGVLRFKKCETESCNLVPAGAAAAAAAAAGVGPGAACSVGAGTAVAAAAVASGVGAAAAAAAAAAAGGSPGRLRKMCCSDKIASWNALGLQGALLGQLLEPVYVSSITIGGPAADFCEGAVCRAVCCRLAPDLPTNTSSSSGGSSGSSAGRDSHRQDSKRQHLMGAGGSLPHLPPQAAAAAQRGLKLDAPFRVNHPKVMHAPPSSGSSMWVPRITGHGTCSESLNWNAAEKGELEVVTAASGTVLRLLSIPPPTDAAAGTHDTCGAAGAGGSSSGSGSSSAQSRLSKAALFDWWHQLQASAGAYAAGERPDVSMQQDQDGAAAEAGGSGVGERVTYAAAKAVNASYAAAKAALHAHFLRSTQQGWLRVAAVVPDLEAFTTG